MIGRDGALAAIFHRNRLWARRNNLVLFGWLIPFASLFFNWLSQLADEDRTGVIGGSASRLNMFQPFTVVIIYIFVNVLVAWLVAAVLALKEHEGGMFDLVRLTSLSPGAVFAGHALTQAAIILPQIAAFHAGILVYSAYFLTGSGGAAGVSWHLQFAVVLINVANAFLVQWITLCGVFGRPAMFIVIGGAAAFLIVPANFFQFWAMDYYGMPLYATAGMALAPLAIVALVAHAWGRRKWYAG